MQKWGIKDGCVWLAFKTGLRMLVSYIYWAADTFKMV